MIMLLLVVVNARPSLPVPPKEKISSTGRAPVNNCHRAEQTWDTYLADFLSPNPTSASEYIINTWPAPSDPKQPKWTAYWVFAEGWNAIIDYARLGSPPSPPSVSNWSTTFQWFYNGQSNLGVGGGWLDNYFDDECWMINTLLSAYEFANSTLYLNQAVEIWNDVSLNAWDTTCCGTEKGGNWWDRSPHTQKATASNAGAVIAGARLYQLTQNHSYLDHSLMIYQYWQSEMVNQTSGQVADHLTVPNGEKVWWSFTYNQGLMIGAAVELYKALGGAGGSGGYLLADARLYASYLLSELVVPSPLDPKNSFVLSDGCTAGQDCSGDCSQFKGPTVRYLIALIDQLESWDPLRRSLQAMLLASADSLWTVARDDSSSPNPQRTMFGCDWTTPYQWTNTSSSAPVYQTQQNIALSTFSLVVSLEEK